MALGAVNESNRDCVLDLSLSRLGYYKLTAAASVPEITEPKIRNGIQNTAHIHEVRIKNNTMEADSNLVLWRRPFTTIEYFFRELFIVSSIGLQRVRGCKAAAAATATALCGLAVWAALQAEGAQRAPVAWAVERARWALWWALLGVLSSVGLGTGLHTFLLYLGPHVARVTLAAYECGSLAFPEPPYPATVLCPETPASASASAAAAVSVWAIMAKVRLECMMWGVGTALGELPPYFMARAASASPSAPAPAPASAVASPSVSDRDSFTDKCKAWMERVVAKVGFFGILACASVPNPLFDLAGITCGHFHVPFWTFFGATLIGKAVIKMHIQKMFIIVAFNDALVMQALSWVQKIPYIGPQLEAPFLEFFRNQKARLHKSEGGEQGSLLSSVLEKLVLAMVLYFVVSIVNSLAQSYSKRIGKKKSKKQKE